MNIKEGLSLKQINEAIELLESTEPMVELAYLEAKESGSKSIRDTRAFEEARKQVNKACAILGIDSPPVFAEEADKKFLD
jgi:hypothetical protein